MMKKTNSYLWYRVCKIDQIPVKEGRSVELGDHKVALFHLEDGFLAIDNQCPHRKGPLADGIVAGKAVFCPLHSWKVDIATGCVLSGGEGRVKCYPVKVVQGDVYINFEAADQVSREVKSMACSSGILEDKNVGSFKSNGFETSI